MSAEKLAENVCSNLYYIPCSNSYRFYEPSGVCPRQLFAMIVIHGRKGWDSRGGVFAVQ